MDRHFPFDINITDKQSNNGPSPRPNTPTALEGIPDFPTSTSPPPTPHQAAEALLLYTTILLDCERDSLPLSPTSKNPLLHPFFLALHEHCPTTGKSNVLFVILHALFPPSDCASLHRDPTAILLRARAWLQKPSANVARCVDVYDRLQTLADDLLRGFFIPFQAAGGHTPIPTQTHDDVDASPTPLSGLRAACLLRDSDRCVITRELDWSRQSEYNAQHPTDPSEEDNVTTKVTHIIPHSFNTQNADGTIGPARTYIWRIMNTLDPGISKTLAGTTIDTPRNALTLCADLHFRFGHLKWYLEPTQTPHSYTMHLPRGERIPRRLLPPGDGVVTFNAAAAEPPPEPRLLAFHRACCLILRVSGAGEYVNRVLVEMDRMVDVGVLAADGSSDLSQFWRLRDVLGVGR